MACTTRDDNKIIIITNSQIKYMVPYFLRN